MLLVYVKKHLGLKSEQFYNEALEVVVEPFSLAKWKEPLLMAGMDK